MLVYIVACYSSRRLVNIMTTEKERHRKEKLRLHRTSKVKLGWPQNSEGVGGNYCWLDGTTTWMLHTCQVSRAPACCRSLVNCCEVAARFPISTAHADKNIRKMMQGFWSRFVLGQRELIINKERCQKGVKLHEWGSWDRYLALQGCNGRNT